MTHHRIRQADDLRARTGLGSARLPVTAAGAHGLTATEVIGLGQAHRQPGASSSAACAALLPRVRVDIVVQDDVVDGVISSIPGAIRTAFTGRVQAPARRVMTGATGPARTVRPAR